MGFHTCEYCTGEKAETSSGDVTLKFDGGAAFVVPDMITHYVRDHGFQPPKSFVDAVMNRELIGGDRRQTRGVAAAPEEVGYLRGEFPKGEVPPSFLAKLERVIELASRDGGRAQTRGAVVYRGAPEAK